MKKNLSQYLEQQWIGAELYFLRSPERMANYLLESLDLKANDYLICDPLVPAFLMEAIKAQKIELIFIDLKAIDGSLDLDLLEDFLSLSTLINEKDELIYRKDNAPIKGVISNTPWFNQEELQRFLFTAKRYYLKTILTTGDNDLMHPEASQYYQADLIAGPIQIAGQAISLVVKPLVQKGIPILSGFGKPLRNPVVLKTDQIADVERFSFDPNSIGFNQNLNHTKPLRRPFVFPGFMKVFHPGQAALKDQLHTQGFISRIPLGNRLNDLKAYTFLSRSKAGQKYLEQILEIKVKDQQAILDLEKLLKTNPLASLRDQTSKNEQAPE